MQSLTRCGTIRTTIKKNDGKVFLFHSTRHESLFDNNLCMLCFCSICDILWFLDGIRSRESEKRKIKQPPDAENRAKNHRLFAFSFIRIDDWCFGAYGFSFLQYSIFCCITDIGYSIKGGLEHERELRTQTKQCSWGNRYGGGNSQVYNERRSRKANKGD